MERAHYQLGFFETRIAGLQGRTMRTKLPGIGYRRLMWGFPGWAKWRGRYKQAMRIVAKKDVYATELPIQFGINDTGPLKFPPRRSIETPTPFLGILTVWRTQRIRDHSPS